MSAPAVPVSPPGRLLDRLVLLLVLVLLFFAQLVLNLASWFDWDISDWTLLWRFDCVIPAFCDLRFPKHAFVALVAVTVAGALFAWRIARHAVIRDLPGAPLPRVLPALVRAPVLIPLGISIGLEGWIIRRALRGELISPLPWLIGLGALVALGLQIDRQGGDPPPWPTPRRLLETAGYGLGIVLLVVALASLASGRPALLLGSAIAAAILLVSATASGWRLSSTGQRLERVAIPVLTAGSFLLLSHGLSSWAWSFLGDEYSFFDSAKEILAGHVETSRFLSGEGTYGYHPMLASVIQATTMRLFGATSYGWRVSHSFLLALTIPPFYLFARRLLGRAGGLVTVGLYGSAHVLLSFGKLGSNNSQAVIFLPLALATLVYAISRGRVTGFVLTGIVLGLGFYTFGIARIWSLVVAAWLFFTYFAFRREALRRTALAFAAVVVPSVLTALPVLSTRSAWEGQLHHTILQSEVATTPVAIFQQFLRNTLYGFLSFLTNNGHGVFVYGPHADPITACLVVLGIATVVGTLCSGLRIRLALVATYLVLVVCIAGIQQYAYPNITRLFALVPLYAISAGLGFTALRALLRSRDENRRGRTLCGVLLVLGLAVLLNVWMSVGLSQERIEQFPLAFILQNAELTADRSGRGPILYTVVPVAYEAWVHKLAEVYAVPEERVRLLRPYDALGDEAVCRPDQPAVFSMFSSEIPIKDAILSRMHACWPKSPIHLVKDGLGHPVLYRLVTPAALASVHPIPGFWSEEPYIPPKRSDQADREPWSVQSPRSLAAGADGRLVTVEGASGAALVFDAKGRLQKVLAGAFVDPSSAAFTPEGGVVVVDAGAPDSLVQFDAQGKVIRRFGNGTGMASPRGICVTPDGRVFVADTGSSRVVVFGEGNTIAKVYTGGGRFKQPLDVAVSADGRIAVADPAARLLFIVDGSDHVLEEHPATAETSWGVKPGLAWRADGRLLMSDALNGRVVEVGRDEIVVAKGLDHPTALAVHDGVLYVVEAEANRISSVELKRETRISR